MRLKMVMALGAILLLSGSKFLCAQLGKNFPHEMGFTVTSDVTYATGAHGPLKADAFIPRGAGPFPGIVFIHGGGWKNGDRHQMIKLIQALAEDGYVGFTIDYDVDPVHFPASFHESLAAVKFFRAHATEYRLDPARVGVAGSSAGGELAALVALNPEGTTFDRAPTKEEAKSGESARVQAAVILNGALDLTSQDETASTSVADYLGGPCSSRPRDCKDASPLFHVHGGAPPFYVGHGTVDQSVPFSEAVAFTDVLKAANVPVQFFQAEGGKHAFWVDPRFYAENLESIEAFLDLHLKGNHK
ncbi:MAG TPA: alpha/beta hydrolase [Terracidiphilus sp.]|nr:alpha/beta hydrolase [Terracidiphilus sp.]